MGMIELLAFLNHLVLFFNHNHLSKVLHMLQSDFRKWKIITIFENILILIEIHRKLYISENLHEQHSFKDAARTSSRFVKYLGIVFACIIITYFCIPALIMAYHRWNGTFRMELVHFPYDISIPFNPYTISGHLIGVVYELGCAVCMMLLLMSSDCVFICGCLFAMAYQEDLSEAIITMDADFIRFVRHFLHTILPKQLNRHHKLPPQNGRSNCSTEKCDCSPPQASQLYYVFASCCELHLWDAYLYNMSHFDFHLQVVSSFQGAVIGADFLWNHQHHTGCSILCVYLSEATRPHVHICGLLHVGHIVLVLLRRNVRHIWGAQLSRDVSFICPCPLPVRICEFIVFCRAIASAACCTTPIGTHIRWPNSDSWCWCCARSSTRNI